MCAADTENLNNSFLISRRKTSAHVGRLGFMYTSLLQGRSGRTRMHVPLVSTEKSPVLKLKRTAKPVRRGSTVKKQPLHPTTARKERIVNLGQQVIALYVLVIHIYIIYIYQFFIFGVKLY